MPEAKPNSPSLLKAALLGLGIFVLLYFLIIAMNTRDLLWFWPKFEEVPVGVVVHCYGADVEIKPGEPAFEAVNAAVNSSLSGTKRWDQLSMSDETYQEYQTSPTSMVLELIYDPPVSIHSQYAFFKNVNRVVIPLDGRHASTNSVFARSGGYSNAGSYHVKSITPIVTAIQEQGFCAKP